MGKRKREVAVSRGKSKEARLMKHLAQCTTTIKMRLASFTKPSPLLQPFLQAIQTTTKIISKVQFLACDLLNLHWTRLLEEEKEFPVLDQSFILKCVTIVTDTKRGNQDTELNVTLNQMRELHPFQKPRNKYMNHFLAALARQLLTNLVNHVVMNTKSRVIKYIRFKYNLDKSDAIFFINESFNNMHPKLLGQYEFRDLCQFNSFYDNLIEENLNHFISLSWKCLLYQETLPERTSGKKTFTLAPLKADFIASSILVNKTTIYKRIPT